MAQRQLDLFEVAGSLSAELGAGRGARVCQARSPGHNGRPGARLPLVLDGFAFYDAALGDRREEPSLGDPRRPGPLVEAGLDPGRDGMVRQRPPLPSRSGLSQRASRRWTSLIDRPTFSARRRPQPISRARLALSGLPPRVPQSFWR